MIVTSPCENLTFLSDKVVRFHLHQINEFIYEDENGKRYLNGESFGPIATLKMQKNSWQLEHARTSIQLMLKTFALLFAYSPEYEQIKLTFTPSADQCLHAFLEINPLWVQFTNHNQREIYHFPFVYGRELQGLRNFTAELFMKHFDENPFLNEEATSCSSCCLSPNPPMPIPEGW
jgi:hypothetical protein